MESITIKVDTAMAKEIEKAMNPDYSTKSEFIREAIRDKLETKRAMRIQQRILEQFGKGKPKTNKSDREIREEVGRELAKEFDIILP